MQILFNPTISYLVICSTDTQARGYKNVCTEIFNAVLFVVARQESKNTKQ